MSEDERVSFFPAATDPESVKAMLNAAASGPPIKMRIVPDGWPWSELLVVVMAAIAYGIDHPEGTG